VQRIRRAKALDDDDVVALVHDRQRQASVDPAAIGDYSAGIALALIAPLLAACQMQALAQCVEQRRARIEAKRIIPAIDPQLNSNRRYLSCSTARDRLHFASCE
jgi:hypothetical protein